MIQIGGRVLAILFVLAIAYTKRISAWSANRLDSDVQSIVNADSMNPTSQKG